MREKSSVRTVKHGVAEIEYTLQRKKVKNINLRINQNGVSVSATKTVPAAYIDEFVLSKGDYILKAMEKFGKLAEKRAEPRRYLSGEIFYILGKTLYLSVQESCQEGVCISGDSLIIRVKSANDTQRKEKLTMNFFRNECLEIFRRLASEIYPIFRDMGVKEPEIRVRKMRSRWGSCMTAKSIITLNTRLVEAPEECIRYVILHEFCHFIHPNHSKQFHALVTKLMPEWKILKKELNKSVVL